MRAVKPNPASAKPAVGGTSEDRCEQCGDRCETKPYNASTGKTMSLCDGCYDYGTDQTYSPSQSESSEDESDAVKSESDHPDSDDGDDSDD